MQTPPPGTGPHRTLCAASGPHPHLHVLPYWSSLLSPQDGPTSQGAACTWAWLLGPSAEVEEVPALQQVQGLQVVLKRAPCEVLRKKGRSTSVPA